MELGDFDLDLFLFLEGDLDFLFLSRDLDLFFVGDLLFFGDLERLPVLTGGITLRGDLDRDFLLPLLNRGEGLRAGDLETDEAHK